MASLTSQPLTRPSVSGARRRKSHSLPRHSVLASQSYVRLAFCLLFNMSAHSQNVVDCAASSLVAAWRKAVVTKAVCISSVFPLSAFASAQRFTHCTHLSGLSAPRLRQSTTQSTRKLLCCYLFLYPTSLPRSLQVLFLTHLSHFLSARFLSTGLISRLHQSDSSNFYLLFCCHQEC